MGLPDAKTNLEEIARDIAADLPASDLSARLKALEPDCASDPTLRASFLTSRGIVLNRLGLSADALGDLHEARGLYATAEDKAGTAKASREIARVHSWRGDGREAALALLYALAADDSPANVALSTFESGRLNLEIGRLAEAKRLLRYALDAPADAWTAVDRLRTQALLVQTLVVAGDLEAADVAIAGIDLTQAGARIQHLVAIETARIAARRGDLGKAQQAVETLRSTHPPPPDSFEAVEITEVDAEITARDGRPDEALPKIRTAIARFAEDDLAGREVVARLREAEILGGLGRDDEAGRTLLAALHRAIGRGLTGYVDMARAELAKRNLSVLAWAPGSAPTQTTAPAASERYVRRRPLGEGGFGSVMSAYDLETGEEVALKRLRLSEIYDVATRKGRLESARHEAAATSRLQHPGIGRVYGLVVDEDGDGLLARELIEGPTLREALAHVLPNDVKLSILSEFTQAVAAIHTGGIVHRDLKPENVVLKGGRHPVIIDFGAASIGARDKGGGFSALYAAPEQIAGRPVDARADLFAVGMIVAEVMLGTRPERAGKGPIAAFRYWRGLRRLAPTLAEAGCPPAAARLAVQALALHPAARPSEIGPLVAALQARS